MYEFVYMNLYKLIVHVKFVFHIQIKVDKFICMNSYIQNCLMALCSLSMGRSIKIIIFT